MKEIKILDDLKNLIPQSLSDDEYSQLEQNCLLDGIRDPLVLWNGTLIDGHNRYRIAKENDLPYEVMNLNHFKDINAVKIWMIDNQKGRRNLIDFVKYELAQIKAAILRRREGRNKKKAGECMAKVTVNQRFYQ